MRATAVILLLAPTLASAGFFDDVTGAASGIGDFFGNQWNGVKSLFASNQQDLEGNVGRVVDLLKGIQQKVPMLEGLASDSQKKTLSQIGNFMSQVTGFQNQLRSDGEAKFDQNKSKWEQMAKSIFETGGLGDIVKLISSASAPGSTCFIAAAVLPVVYLLR